MGTGWAWPLLTLAAKVWLQWLWGQGTQLPSRQGLEPGGTGQDWEVGLYCSFPRGTLGKARHGSGLNSIVR